jgi:hypothetical protein
MTGRLYYDAEGYAITLGYERHGPVSPLREALSEIANKKAGCASAVAMRGIARWALRDASAMSGSAQDAQRLDPKGASATREAGDAR